MDNHFSNNWIKEKKRNSTDILRDTLKSQQPLKPKMELAKNKIQTQNRKLDSMMEKLKAREKAYFEQVISSLQKHDSQQGKMISNELAQVRKTTRTMSQIKLALEQVHMRLESTIDIGDSMAALGPAIGALSNIKSKINDVLPQADGELNEINTTFNDILTNASGMGNNTFDFNNYGEDVGKILDEASFIAEQRTGMDIQMYLLLEEKGISRNRVQLENTLKIISIYTIKLLYFYSNKL
jgi:division protein CdvB (Snf7/Vps24/ESCRT-III family)